MNFRRACTKSRHAAQVAPTAAPKNPLSSGASQIQIEVEDVAALPMCESADIRSGHTSHDLGIGHTKTVSVFRKPIQGKKCKLALVKYCRSIIR